MQVLLWLCGACDHAAAVPALTQTVPTATPARTVRTGSRRGAFGMHRMSSGWRRILHPVKLPFDLSESLAAEIFSWKFKTP